jgi:hypothetical protein
MLTPSPPPHRPDAVFCCSLLGFFFLSSISARPDYLAKETETFRTCMYYEASKRVHKFYVSQALKTYKILCVHQPE